MLQLQPLGRVATAPRRQITLREEILGGLRVCHLPQAVRRSAIKYAAAELACVWTDIDDPVSTTHHFEIVLDYESRVARLLQFPQGGQQCLPIRRVQSSRWLIEHIHDAEQVGANLGGEP